MIPLDFNTLTALFNFLATAGNLMWSWRLNSMRGSGQLIAYWQAESEKKDSEMEDMKEDIKKLHKRLGVYQKYHNHKPLA